MRGSDLPEIRPLAGRDGEAAFEEPWQAHTLAVALSLAENGILTRSEWSAALGAELRRRAALGEPDSRHTYYVAALSALEMLLIRSALITETALRGRTEQWRHAYLNTTHGRPVELDPGSSLK